MKKQIILIILFLSYSIFSFSQEVKQATKAEINTIYLNIKKVSEKTKSLKCSFVQEKTISILEEVFTSKGIMYYQKPNSLRWQYEEPYKYLFILHEGKVLIKDGDKTSKFDANGSKIFKEISEIMIASVDGSILKDEKRFAIQYFVSSKQAIVQLVPKDKTMKKLMNSITLTFDKSDWLVRTIEMEESLGDKSVIKFKVEKVNASISRDLFNIK